MRHAASRARRDLANLGRGAAVRVREEPEVRALLELRERRGPVERSPVALAHDHFFPLRDPKIPIFREKSERF